jgi:hypothetical protein
MGREKERKIIQLKFFKKIRAHTHDVGLAAVATTAAAATTAHVGNQGEQRRACRILIRHASQIFRNFPAQDEPLDAATTITGQSQQSALALPGLHQSQSTMPSVVSSGVTVRLKMSPASPAPITTPPPQPMGIMFAGVAPPQQQQPPPQPPVPASLMPANLPRTTTVPMQTAPIGQAPTQP